MHTFWFIFDFISTKVIEQWLNFNLKFTNKLYFDLTSMCGVPFLPLIDPVLDKMVDKNAKISIFALSLRAYWDLANIAVDSQSCSAFVP